MWDWCLVMVNLLDTVLAKAFSSWKFRRPTSLEASTTKARSRVTGQYLMETGNKESEFNENACWLKRRSQNRLTTENEAYLEV